MTTQATDALPARQPGGHLQDFTRPAKRLDLELLARVRAALKALPANPDGGDGR